MRVERNRVQQRNRAEARPQLLRLPRFLRMTRVFFARRQPDVHRLFLAAALAVLALARPLCAQSTRPWLEWRTLRTEHFDLHYPAELDAWSRDVATRLEGVRSVVAASVGSAPSRRVTVVIDNPA